MEGGTNRLPIGPRVSPPPPRRRVQQEGTLRKQRDCESTYFSTQLNYDNYAYLLTDEIYNRKGKKDKFQEWELWYLLFTLSAAQTEMKSKLNSKVGDIRPQNVFLNSEGKVRVSSLLSWPREVSNFSKTFDNEKTYLAPEDMNKLEMGGLEDSSNYSSEVFSIGFTVLSAAVQENFEELYNTKNYKFNFEKADQHLHQWRNNTDYSEIFTAFISNMCSYSPERRLTEKELWGWISQYENEIKHKEDFVIQTAPQKIEREIDELR